VPTGGLTAALDDTSQPVALPLAPLNVVPSPRGSASASSPGTNPSIATVARPDPPRDIHSGLAAAKWQQRAEVLRAVSAAHPERFPARGAGPTAARGGVEPAAAPAPSGGGIMTTVPMPNVSFHLATPRLQA